MLKKFYLFFSQFFWHTSDVNLSINRTVSRLEVNPIDLCKCSTYSSTNASFQGLLFFSQLVDNGYQNYEALEPHPSFGSFSLFLEWPDALISRSKLRRFFFAEKVYKNSIFIQHWISFKKVHFAEFIYTNEFLCTMKTGKIWGVFRLNVPHN